MPIVNIQILEGRSEENIRSLVSGLTHTVSKELGVSKERIRVIVQEIPKNRWAVGAEVVAKRKRI